MAINIPNGALVRWIKGAAVRVYVQTASSPPPPAGAIVRWIRGNRAPIERQDS